jgi:8-oxo-dGTP pyrophosphatase MutT (NUDIX family)
MPPILQAGALVFRVENGRPEILVVRSRKQPGQWVFPKGHLERNESPGTAALRETQEEAGIVGRIVRALHPPLEFRSGDEDVSVQYYLVEKTGEVPPLESRAKQWLAPEAALAALTHPSARTLLREALPHIRKEMALIAARPRHLS